MKDEPWPGYAPLPARPTEEDLFAAYRNPGPSTTTTDKRRKGRYQTVGCVCGGTMTADPMAEGSVTFGVQAHQRTPGHILWRERFEEGGVFIVGRVVETPDGTFLEPLERVE